MDRIEQKLQSGLYLESKKIGSTRFLPLLVMLCAVLVGSILAALRSSGLLAQPHWLYPLLLIGLPALAAGGFTCYITCRGQDQAREALAEAQMRYSSMFAESRAVMLLIEPDMGRLVDANQAAVNFYGYSKERLLQMKVTDLNTLVDDAVFDYMAQASRRVRSHFTFRHCLASGEIRDVEVYSSPVQIAGQSLLYSIIHDITERRKAETALQASERRLREMLENVRLAAMTISPDHKVTFCNDFFARITERCPDEVIGQPWVETFVPAEQHTERRMLLDNILKGEQISYHMEREILTRSGGRRLISWNLFPLHAEGQVIGVAGIGEDMTERRRAEQDALRRMNELAALQKTGRCLTTSQNINEVLAGIVAAVRLMLGSEAVLIWLNDHQQQMVECAAADADPAAGISLPKIGVRLPETALLPALPVDLHREAQLCIPLMYKDSPVGILQVARGASEITEHHLLILSTLADLAAIAVVTYQLVDVEREQRSLLERSQAQLIHSEKLNAMGRLVAFLAHEINNPIQSLRGGMNLLLECPMSEEKRREYLELCSREVERLSGIVERVLGFYRRTSDIPCRVDLHQLLDETLKLLEKRMERARVTLVRQYDNCLPCVDGFYDQFHQVFLNLILNGINAMPAGGTLTFTTHCDVDQVQVIISDTGVGIPPDVLPHIFEPFYTSRKDGCGLGLAICSNIVEKHNGRIDVESTSGAGSTFTITLPIQPK
jgi:PAS domain S-box-containing protein